MEWPKCGECEGDGKRRVYYEGHNGPIPVVIDHQPCPACNGTGERDLTADEAAEFHFDPQKQNSRGDRNYYIEGLAGYEYKIFEVIWDPPGEYGDTRFLAEGKTLTEALNAAARAIAGKE